VFPQALPLFKIHCHCAFFLFILKPFAYPRPASLFCLPARLPVRATPLCAPYMGSPSTLTLFPMARRFLFSVGQGDGEWAPHLGGGPDHPRASNVNVLHALLKGECPRPRSPSSQRGTGSQSPRRWGLQKGAPRRAVGREMVRLRLGEEHTGTTSSHRDLHALEHLPPSSSMGAHGAGLRWRMPAMLWEVKALTNGVGLQGLHVLGDPAACQDAAVDGRVQGLDAPVQLHHRAQAAQHRAQRRHSCARPAGPQGTGSAAQGTPQAFLRPSSCTTGHRQRSTGHTTGILAPVQLHHRAQAAQHAS